MPITNPVTALLALCSWCNMSLLIYVILRLTCSVIFSNIFSSYHRLQRHSISLRANEYDFRQVAFWQLGQNLFPFPIPNLATGVNIPIFIHTQRDYWTCKPPHQAAIELISRHRLGRASSSGIFKSRYNNIEDTCAVRLSGQLTKECVLSVDNYQVAQWHATEILTTVTVLIE